MNTTDKSTGSRSFLAVLLIGVAAGMLAGIHDGHFASGIRLANAYRADF